MKGMSCLKIKLTIEDANHILELWCDKENKTLYNLWRKAIGNFEEKLKEYPIPITVEEEINITSHTLVLSVEEEKAWTNPTQSLKKLVQQAIQIFRETLKKERPEVSVSTEYSYAEYYEGIEREYYLWEILKMAKEGELEQGDKFKALELPFSVIIEYEGRSFVYSQIMDDSTTRDTVSLCSGEICSKYIKIVEPKS